MLRMRKSFPYNSPRAHESVVTIGVALVVVLATISIVVVLIMPWNYAAIMCSSLIFLAAFLIRPKWGTYSLIFLVPFTTSSVHFLVDADWNFIVGKSKIDLIPIFAIIVLVTFLGFVLRKLGKVEKGASGNIIAIPVFVLFLYSGLTILWSESKVHSLFQYLIFVMNIGIFVLITAYVREEKDLAAAVWCFILSGMLQAAAYIVCFFLRTYIFETNIFLNVYFVLNIVGGYFQSSGMPLTDGGFMDHHQFALMINLVLAVSFGLFLTKSGRLKKALLAVSMTTFIFVVLHTQSRAGIGSLLVMACFAFFAFQSIRKYWFRLCPIFVVVVIAFYFIEAAVTGAITGKYTTPRLIVLGQKMQTSQNLIDPGLKEKTGRMRLWKKSFDEYKEQILRGFGVGNLKKVMHAPHAHNVFLSFLFDFGIIGLTCIISIIYILVKRFKMLLPHQISYSQIMSIAFGAGLVAIGFHGQFDFEYNTTLLWLYLGLTISAFRIAHQVIHGNNSTVPGSKVE